MQSAILACWHEPKISLLFRYLELGEKRDEALQIAFILIDAESYPQHIATYVGDAVAGLQFGIPALRVRSPEGEEAEPLPDESGGSDLSVSYTVALAQDDLVSVKFDVSNYEAGAAHPNPYSHVLNYDLKNGKQLKLSDLFKPGAKFLQTLRRLIENPLMLVF